MALTLSVGFVVDDAIVMLENIVRHMEMGEKRMDAALRGSREIGFTIVSMTLSLVAVFIPVLFMGGIVGRLLHEFAVTISMAILVSGFVSLTLTPMLASRFLKPAESKKHGGMYRALESAFQALAGLYERTLQVVLRHQPATVGVLALLIGATAYQFVTMPKGFLPSQDTNQLFGVTEGAQDISFDSMIRHQQKVARIIRAHPAVQSMSSVVGTGAVNSGRVFIRLKDRAERSQRVDQVIQELRPRLAEIPGINVFLQNPPLVRVGGTFTKSLYQMTLQSANPKEIYQWAPLLETRMRGLDGFQDVTTDLQINSPQVMVEIRRDRARALGVTAEQIQSALFSAYGDRLVSTIYTPSNEYSVILEVAPEFQMAPEALSRVYVRSAAGKLVRLDALARLKRGVGPLSVNHYGQLPAVSVSFNLRPGYSLGDAAVAVEAALREMRMPATVSASFQGTVQAFRQSFRGLSVSADRSGAGGLHCARRPL
jgi:hydrophobic/amphiphilic exporter-1 (mainly G- bacteria), HAE1 family